ncbi:hypothetical protein N7520_003658 [Penicillium odoratum]|uniref:uncharacterized protein n=1 Tax=Penicillium odoratum TaxID=1167516 RepID=UPI0025490272|nr:uncharacterized protein N7520_003658 [Penicillium odoratum]KAJ5769099.1 hypothetical protein N7520_003658 [Penicillium odoratum]
MYSHTLLAALAIVPLVAASSSLGCFSAVPNLKDVKQYTFQSQAFCLNQCTEAGFHIAALKDGVTCGCSNTIPLSSAMVDDDKCDQYCAGWPEDNCGGINVYTVLTTGEYHGSSDSNSNSNSTIPRTGRNIVAPTVNPSSMPTSILTAPSSMGTKVAITALPAAKSNAASAAITAVTSATPSATANAAGTLRAGSLAGILVAGLGLLL